MHTARLDLEISKERREPHGKNWQQLGLSLLRICPALLAPLAVLRESIPAGATLGLRISFSTASGTQLSSEWEVPPSDSDKTNVKIVEQLLCKALPGMHMHGRR